MSRLWCCWVTDKGKTRDGIAVAEAFKAKDKGDGSKKGEEEEEEGAEKTDGTGGISFSFPFIIASAMEAAVIPSAVFPILERQSKTVSLDPKPCG